MERLRLKCKVCGEFHDIVKKAPAEFEGWAYSVVEWSDLTDQVPPLSEEHWPRSETLPRTGETRIIKVGVTFDEFPGNGFYADYRTADAFFNGHETEDQLGNSAIVKCRFDEVLLSDEYSAWIRVTVLQVLPYDKLAELLPTRYINEALEDYIQVDDTEDIGEKWRIITWSAQGDLGDTIFIFKDSSNVRHMVVRENWCMSKDIVYFGNVMEKKN